MGIVPLGVPAPVTHVVTTGPVDGLVLPVVRGPEIVARQATTHDVGDGVRRHAHGAHPRAAGGAVLAPQVREAVKDDDR